MTKRRVLGGMLACLVVGGAGGWLVTHALADGVPPTPGSIYYSGEISNVSGTAFGATSAHIQVRLFDRESATGATMYCAVDAPSTPVAGGHFRVALDPSGYTACLDALHAHATVFIEVQVETEILPREQIGAVPYALEASDVTRSGPRGDSASASAFCGYSALTNGAITDGAAHGYYAAHSLCAATAGCRPTAHMCSSTELALSAQLGLPATAAPSGVVWCSGERTFEVYPPDGNTIIDGCAGWTSAMHAESGAGHGGQAYDYRVGARPTWAFCETMHPIACCD